MSNTGLLTIIAVILIGIFTVLIIQMTEETPEEKIGNAVADTMETVQNNINSDG